MFCATLFQKITALFSAIVLLLSTAVCGNVYAPAEPSDNTMFKVVGEAMTLISNGSSDYVIVRGANASPSEVNAAATLSDYLKKISAVALPVVTDETAAADKEIIVGKTNRETESFTVDRADLGSDGYSIKTSGDKLLIAGGEMRGTLYGVYAFLENYLNCRWFTSKLIRVPESSKVEIPSSIDFTEKPYLEYRETDWISPRDTTYSIANRLNGNIYRRLSDANGGNFSYSNIGFAHTLTTQIVKSSVYFNDHPEYFALGVKSGERTPNQLCLTNPDTLRIAIADVLSSLAATPTANIISVTQHDNQNYCVCDKCKAIDEEEGSHSGTLIRFINAIADAVKEAGYAAKVDTFAYQYTRSAPKITVPRDNVIIRFCTIECCFAHPISECEDAESMRKDLDDWKKICNTLYVWDYTTNYSNYLAPFPDFGVIQQNLQYFVEHNVVGVYEEGNYSASSSNGEFAELRAYLLSKLMWNPYIDMDKAMNEFLEAYYGSGWKSIRKYIDMTTANTGRFTFNGRQHMGIYTATDKDSVLYLNKNQIKYCDDLWNEAFEADASAEQTLHLRLSEISWRYWKGCNKVLEFSRLPGNDWKKSNEQLYNDIVELGITGFRESGNLTDKPDFAKTPAAWEKKS